MADPVEEINAMFAELKRKTDAYYALVDARQAYERALADARAASEPGWGASRDAADDHHEDDDV